MKLLLVILVSAALLTFPTIGIAGDKKEEATGTLTIGDNTYKLTRVLAYETVRFNRKETVVLLSEKPLDLAKLKLSLKKNGSDEGFNPFEAHVKLRFDAKGALTLTAIYADGANVILGGSDDIKAAATIKDGLAKGKASMEKPGKFFKMAYQFEVAFETSVIPAVTPEPKKPVDPITKKTPPDDPTKPVVGAEKDLRFEGKLTDQSPMVMGKPAEIHQVKMSAGKSYVIDLVSSEFDTYLRVLDPDGKLLASDDDSGEELNARLRFSPPKDGNYQFVATRFGGGEGSYVLTVKVMGGASKPADRGKVLVVTEKELRVEGVLANESPMVMGKAAQVHLVKMSAEKTYLIDLESKQFDPYLRIIDSTGKQLASDDDGGVDRNARLRFTPPNDGNYQVVATRFGGRAGDYLLKIRVLPANEDK